MSSVASAGLAQIPRNSHFRYINLPGVTTAQIISSVNTFNPTSGVAPILTNTVGGVTGNFTGTTPWSLVAGPVLPGGGSANSTPYTMMSAGTALFKDMGDTIISAGRTFRRVQLVNPFVINEQTGGTYSGVDTDACTGYIEVGFRGGAIPGPFVRGY